MFKVDFMTPDRTVATPEVEVLVLPSVDGEIGLLQNHAPILVQLKAGEIRTTINGAVEHFAISGGFAEMFHNRASIMAETAEMAHEIDVERARLAADRARDALRSSQPENQMEILQAALQRALVRLRVAESVRRSPASVAGQKPGQGTAYLRWKPKSSNKY